MLVVYETDTGRIIGHCGTVFDNGTWREATLEELYPTRDRSNLAALSIPDSPRFLELGKEHYRLRRDPQGMVTGIETLPALGLTCDADDSDNDGVPDLPADGQATTQVSAAVPGGAGVDVTFRTTRGALAHRTVAVGSDSVASVALRSAAETVAVTVTASAPGYRPARLSLEFIPVEDTGAGDGPFQRGDANAGSPPDGSHA